MRSLHYGYFYLFFIFPWLLMQVGGHHDPIYSKISAEEQLMDDLLIGYNPLILPTPNNSLSVKVPF